MDPSLLGPPDLKVPSPNMSTFGDPLASALSDSLGHGNGTGIGSGTGGGLGPGEGGGTGGGAFRAGVNGVGVPVCLYCPIPQYSDEARKAKYQGTVVLQVTITTDGKRDQHFGREGPRPGPGRKSHRSRQGLEVQAGGRPLAASRSRRSCRSKSPSACTNLTQSKQADLGDHRSRVSAFLNAPLLGRTVSFTEIPTRSYTS